jgi:hypothetical protein
VECPRLVILSRYCAQTHFIKEVHQERRLVWRVLFRWQAGLLSSGVVLPIRRGAFWQFTAKTAIISPVCIPDWNIRESKHTL